MARHDAKYKDEKVAQEAICERISTTTDSLKTICADKDMPSIPTVLKWLRENEEFAIQYARAKREQADLLAEQILEIADTCLIGTKTVEKATGTEITTGDMVDRSRLMVDSRKWLASKLAPKKYGEKLDVTSDGEKLTQAITVKVEGKDIQLQ